MINKILFLALGLFVLYAVIKLGQKVKPKNNEQNVFESPSKCKKCNSYIIGTGPCLCET